MSEAVTNEQAVAFFEDGFDPDDAVVMEPAGFGELVASVKMRDAAQKMVDDAVIAGRGLGLKWPQIAVALGVSPQAARQRYKPLIDALMS